MNIPRYFGFGAARLVLLLIVHITMVLIFITFGFPKMMGFDGMIQYMASLGAPMPMLAVIIAVVMEAPVAILIVPGFFIRPLVVLSTFYTPGTVVIGHHYWNMTGDAAGSNMINPWKNVSIAGVSLLLAITGPGAISFDRCQERCRMWRERLTRYLVDYSHSTRNDISEVVDSSGASAIRPPSSG